MAKFSVRLFGKFSVERGGQAIEGIDSRKVQELFSYLLISRNHPQRRETLCGMLWGDQPSAKSSKCLRHTLWRLRSCLGNEENFSESVLLIDNNWIQFRLPADLWLDIAEFETIFNLIKGKKAQEISRRDLKLLERSADIYRGDLLEGWYQDWCSFERERFQTMYLMLLDKLVQFCELHHKYEVGLTYGMKILRQDHAYERTHRQLMRLYCLIGNRTEALHQYARCQKALREELGVEPSEKTKQLYERICSDSFGAPLSTAEAVSLQLDQSALALDDVLVRLEQYAETLRSIESQVQQEITMLQGALSDPSP